jgi:oxygen-independent coproporphyrinogen-3 oxidase
MADRLSSEVFARYADTPVPRYTSYPTAPHFTTAIGENQYLSWLQSLPATKASFYLHVPFCRAMCWYCGCHTTVARREEPMVRYLDHLDREIELVSDQIRGPLEVSHMHFGGGTPTLMPVDRLEFTMRLLRSRFAFTDDAEVAIEIDPRTLSTGMAESLGSCGFNRASLGVQSFDPVVQASINRVQTFQETETAVQSLRANGVCQINFDLIYGLPNQTVHSCMETAELALALRPDRLAVFGYAHVPSFKAHQRKIGSDTLPDSEQRLAQSTAIAETLSAAGYVQIGLDHFALPGDPLALAAASGRLRRNFQGYTTDTADVLIGFGVSSIGQMPQGFVQNAVRIPDYLRAVREGRLPIAKGYAFAGEDCLRGAIIERLMCDYRVDLASVCLQFESEPEAILRGSDLDSLVSDGLVERDGWSISIPPRARPLVRFIAAAFDMHLSRGGTHSRAV